MSNPTSIIITVLVVLMSAVLIPAGFLLVDAFIDLRRDSKKLKQIQKERDELWDELASNYKK